MKKNYTIAAMLAALLMCTLAGGAMAAEFTTEVSVSFVEKIYFYDFPDGGGMDIDFGEVRLPPLDSAAYIYALDNDHTLRVCDRRANAGGWSISAQMTLMTGGSDESFACQINLIEPTYTIGLTPVTQTNPAATYARVTTSMRKFMDAEADLTQGDYDLTVTLDHTQIAIIANEVAKLKPLSYTGTITWTLTLTP